MPRIIVNIFREVVFYGAIAFFVILAAFPFYWMLITSLKTNPDLHSVANIPFWFNDALTLEHFRYLTEAVGGDRIVAVSLVPANMDAEDYQPRPQDVLRLKNARLLVRVGLDYDLWADRLLAQSGKPEISRGGPGYVDASFAIAVLELRGMSVGPSDGHARGSGNPHYWLDPKNAEIVTGTILEALARIDRKTRPVTRPIA